MKRGRRKIKCEQCGKKNLLPGNYIDIEKHPRRIGKYKIYEVVVLCEECASLGT